MCNISKRFVRRIRRTREGDHGTEHARHQMIHIQRDENARRDRGFCIFSSTTVCGGGALPQKKLISR